jgi:predicted nuclease of predicted toxin-antitoxin system
MSPVVVQELRLAGHNAVHVGEVLRLDAPDEDILEHAARDARVIVAADTDFGALLAARQVAQPSVVLFHRQTGRRPREQAALLLANLATVESDLREGAVVVDAHVREVDGAGHMGPLLAAETVAAELMRFFAQVPVRT